MTLLAPLTNFISRHLEGVYDRTPTFVKVAVCTMAGLYIVKELITLPPGPSKLDWSGLVVGHRGARWLKHTTEKGSGRKMFPENTLEAFIYAIENNADGIEFDVRLIKSGEFVVFHDGFILPHVRFTAPREKGADADDHESENGGTPVSSHGVRNTSVSCGNTAKNDHDDDNDDISSNASNNSSNNHHPTITRSSNNNKASGNTPDPNAKKNTAAGPFSSAVALNPSALAENNRNEEEEDERQTGGWEMESPSATLEAAAEYTFEKIKNLHRLTVSRNNTQQTPAVLGADNNNNDENTTNMEAIFPSSPNEAAASTTTTTTTQNNKSTTSNNANDLSLTSLNPLTEEAQQLIQEGKKSLHLADSPGLLASEMISLNQQKASVSFEDFSLQEIKRLRYIGADRNITVPTLEEVITLCQARKISKVLVEIKTYSINPTKLWDMAKTYVEFYRKHRSFMNSSTVTIAFNPLLLYLIRYLEPEVAVCLLAERALFHEQGSRKLDDEAYRVLSYFPTPILDLFDNLLWFFNREFFLDILGASMYGPKYDFIEEKFMNRLFSKGICVYLWGILSTKDIGESLKRAGVCISCDGNYTEIKDHFAVH